MANRNQINRKAIAQSTKAAAPKKAAAPMFIEQFTPMERDALNAFQFTMAKGCNVVMHGRTEREAATRLAYLTANPLVHKGEYRVQHETRYRRLSGIR